MLQLAVLGICFLLALFIMYITRFCITLILTLVFFLSFHFDTQLIVFCQIAPVMASVSLASASASKVTRERIAPFPTK